LFASRGMASILEEDGFSVIGTMLLNWRRRRGSVYWLYSSSKRALGLVPDLTTFHYSWLSRVRRLLSIVLLTLNVIKDYLSANTITVGAGKASLGGTLFYQALESLDLISSIFRCIRQVVDG
jgi:hypothetical protein